MAATPRTAAHAVGIDLGTTYSCISYLTPQGEPVTIPNAEGELSTPSVVLFDGDTAIVGTEALRHAVAQPERVIQNSKRFMGDRQKFWVVDGQVHRPPDVAALILRKLLDAGEERLGPIKHAVITVPAQFSDLQRQDTAEAGRRAGLERVDIINEPVAAALCYVLSEGMWFAELAHDQTVMVFDLGGGTFDLSLVRYNKSEVKVVASGGDLQLGGIDWNRRIEEFACDEFIKETPLDPRLDKESMQGLAIEVEQTKRSLSVRPKAPLTVQHAGRRKTFSLDQEHFELLTSDLVTRCEQITLALLKDRKLGWAHVDTVLVTGGATRMPMIRKMLQRVSGTTLNTTLSPDQSITQGAAYYAGMLLSGQKFAKTYLGKEASARLSKFKQVSVNARGLGILVRDKETGLRVPHYLLPPHTPLPAEVKQTYGTVVPNQKRVHLHIVESGISPDQPFVKLGACVIEELPADLPVSAPIEVTIRYDEQARVHVAGKDITSGASARAVIIREQNMSYLPSEQARAVEVQLASQRSPAEPPPPPLPVSPSPPAPPTAEAGPVGQSTFRPSPTAPAAARKAPQRAAKKPTVPQPARAVASLDRAERPVPLCNRCGEALDTKGRCPTCGVAAAPKGTPAKGTAPPRKPKAPPPAPDDILDLNLHSAKTEKMPIPKRPSAGPGSATKGTGSAGAQRGAVRKPPTPPGSKSDEIRQGENDFWTGD